MDWARYGYTGESPLNQGACRSRVALVGAVKGWAEHVMDDPTWDVWGMNRLHTSDSQGRFRADRWFEMHEASSQSEDDWDWIRECPVPLVIPPSDGVMVASARYPAPYPLAEIEGFFGRSYWACSFAYQVALAVFSGYSEIGVFGIDLSVGTMRERTVEWANVSWWLGVAEGRGVKVTVAEGALLGRHLARYGVEYDQEREAVEDYVAGCGRVMKWTV